MLVRGSGRDGALWDETERDTSTLCVHTLLTPTPSQILCSELKVTSDPQVPAAVSRGPDASFTLPCLTLLPSVAKTAASSLFNASSSTQQTRPNWTCCTPSTGDSPVRLLASSR